MKRIFWMALCLMTTVTVKSQVVRDLNLTDFYDQFRRTKYEHGEQYDSSIEGSPYENKEFIPGDLVTITNEKFSGIPMQFNLYSNQVEFKNEDGDVMNFENPELIDHIIIGNDKFIYCPYAYGSRVLKGFFIVLVEGPARLLLKKNVILKQAEPPQAYKDAVPAKFVRNPDDFYIQILPAEAKIIDGKKDLQEVLPAYSPEMDDFIKKNKIRFNKPEDMKKLITFYNSISSK
jgi:hypothetical protein